MGLQNFITFILTATLFIITPGIDTLLILNKGLSKGRTSALKTSLGLNTGIILHTLLAGFGLSLLIEKSEIVFNLIKYLGAFYIVYLGIVKMIEKEKPCTPIKNINIKNRLKSDYIAGLTTNILNPKVALFILAFFPQFITPLQTKNPVPYILLGLTYSGIKLVWFIILIFLTEILTKNLKTNHKINLLIDKISGAIFILLGISILLNIL